MRIIPSIEFIPGKSNVGSALSVIGPDFTFSRTTTPVAGVATRVNASGLIETVPDNVLRLDYPIGGGCPAALIEPAATNLVLRSEEFNNAVWAKNDTQILSSNNPAPNGTNTATRIKGNGGANRALQQVITGSSGQTYTGSFWVRRVSGTSNPQIRVGDVTGTVSINPTTTWQRFHFSAVPTTTTVRLAFIMVNDTDEFEIWGAQLETGAIPTSYIPTTAASATRNADVCNVSGVSGYIGQTEGTIYWDIAAIGGVLTGTGNPEFGVRDEAGTNWISLTSNDPSNPFRITARTTTLLILINYQANIASGKAALAWSSAGLVLYVNGVSVATSATNPNFSFSRAIIRTTTMSYKANAFAIYTTRLSNATLESMTSLSQSYAELASSFSYTVI